MGVLEEQGPWMPPGTYLDQCTDLAQSAQSIIDRAVRVNLFRTSNVQPMTTHLTSVDFSCHVPVFTAPLHLPVSKQQLHYHHPYRQGTSVVTFYRIKLCLNCNGTVLADFSFHVYIVFNAIELIT